MKLLSLENLFYIHNENIMITSLRTITSKFLLDEGIIPFNKIFFKPDKKTDQYLEFQKDKNGDILYLEHPKNLRLVFDKTDDNMKQWDRIIWYSWIQNLYESSQLYPSLHKILKLYINELNNSFEKSINHLDFLLQNTNLKPEMIKPYFLMYYEFKLLNYNQLKEINWSKILNYHIDSMSKIFDQIINPMKKEQICLEIFESVKILSKNIDTILNDSENLRKVVNNFKKEVHRILNHYTFYIDTTQINFKLWFLSLSQFLLHLYPVEFSLKKSIVKLNMIFFLALNTDQLLESKKVKYLSWKTDKPKMIKIDQLKSLCRIHPFIRNIHHDEIFF